MQPDVAGAGQGGEKQAFAAKQDVLEALHHLNVEADAGLEHADMAGVNQQALARREIALDHLAGKIEPDHAGAGHLLQDKAVAAEEPMPRRFCQASSSVTDLLRDEETFPCGRLHDCPACNWAAMMAESAGRRRHGHCLSL